MSRPEPSPVPTHPISLRVFLVHGAGHDGSVWDLQAHALRADGFEVLAPDLPGHGSCRNEALRDIESMADWLVEQVGRDDPRAVAIVGHSMGSLVALEACARAPELFASLTLVGTAFPMPVAPALLQAATDEPEKAFAMINNWSFAPPLGEPDPACPLRAANLALMQRQPAGTLASDLHACNAYAGGLAAAASVRCRSTLVCGEADRMTPFKAALVLRDALSAAGRNVPVITLEGAGHSMMSEQPAALTNAIKESISPPD